MHGGHLLAVQKPPCIELKWAPQPQTRFLNHSSDESDCQSHG